jgi:hypothetical protein
MFVVVLPLWRYSLGPRLIRFEILPVDANIAYAHSVLLLF